MYAPLPIGSIAERTGPRGESYSRAAGTEMCRVVDGFGLTVTARVSDICASTINQFLDRGIMGILGPHIRDRRGREGARRRMPIRARRSTKLGWWTRHLITTAPRCSTPRGSERTEFMRQTNANMLMMA